jgi:hypothetical protein
MSEIIKKVLGTVSIQTVSMQDDGKTETQTKVGINKEPGFRAAKVSQKVCGTHIIIAETEDQNVYGNVSEYQIADKVVTQHQEIDGQSNAPSMNAASASNNMPQGKTDAKEDNPSPLMPETYVLKNFVDKIADTVKDQGKEIVKIAKDNGLAMGLAVGGIVVGICALIVAVF